MPSGYILPWVEWSDGKSDPACFYAQPGSGIESLLFKGLWHGVLLALQILLAVPILDVTVTGRN
ncbi:MAG: hypothetical protein Pars92KO_31840 [Parasphingorhabdus sp.]